MNGPRWGRCEICGEDTFLDPHHRKRRSQGGDDSPANIMWICRADHNVIHADPAWAYDQGYLVHSWDDPETVPVERSGAGAPSSSAVGSEPVGETQASPAPGSTCPACSRRIPHPKKPSSPRSKVFSFRVPIDDAETTHELVKSAAEHLGIYEKPNWQYNTLLHGLVLTLQEPA